MLSTTVELRLRRCLPAFCVFLTLSWGAMWPSVSSAAGDGNGQPSEQETPLETPAQPMEQEGESAEAAAPEQDSAAQDSSKPDAPAEEPSQPAEDKEPEEDADKEQEEPPKKKRVIGATAVIKEYQSGLLFEARVDTGAKSCSLNVDQMVIVDEEEGWEENVGKTIKFRISNGKDEPQWIESKIQVVVRIKTSDNVERRYKVPLELQWKNVKKRVTVTLNDRSQMRYPLLVGRNFLKGDFVVDVEKNDTD